MISIIYNHHRSNCLLSICISLSLSLSDNIIHKNMYKSRHRREDHEKE